MKKQLLLVAPTLFVVFITTAPCLSSQDETTVRGEAVGVQQQVRTQNGRACTYRCPSVSASLRTCAVP